MLSDVSSWIDKVNFSVPGGSRWQLLPLVGGLWFLPRLIYHDLQDNFAASWTRHIALLQAQSPAALAADFIDAHVQQLDMEHQQWRVIDLCSGNGNVPSSIEAFVNTKRGAAKRQLIRFELSDVYPTAQLHAWMLHASRSRNLGFIPQAVDPARPPFSAISCTTPGDKKAALEQGYESNDTRVYRLMTSFHRFDDTTAVQVLQSTLETSDAFAIVALQERRYLSLFLVLLETWICFWFSIFWFVGDRTHLFFTYVVPMLPLMQSLDRVVSCLRTRNIDETMALIKESGRRAEHQLPCGEGASSVSFDSWTFQTHRLLHTWPIGYMTIVTGIRAVKQ